MAKPNGTNISPARKKAFENLKIPVESRAILCLDGGGIRGILTIQLLKKLEEVAGIPCYELFDMVAGTSTGGIIASLITTGHAAKILKKCTRSSLQKFSKKNFSGEDFYFLLLSRKTITGIF